MDLFNGVILLLIMGAAVYFLSRFMNRPRMVCTRCQGSGQVDEKWPDPSKPGGWHRLEGQCPKCKGKGRV